MPDHSAVSGAAYPFEESTSPSPPSYAPPPPPPPYQHQADADAPPAYSPTQAPLMPWLAPLRHPSWASTDLALFLPISSKGPVEAGWMAEYAAYLRRGRGLDPCARVHADYMYGTIPEDVQDYIKARIPSELRNAARALACGAECSGPLLLNPLFLDALYVAAGQTSPTVPPTCPPPCTHWMLHALCGAAPALSLLWQTPLPFEDLHALIEALFVLQCRSVFRRAAWKDSGMSVVRRLAALARVG